MEDKFYKLFLFEWMAELKNNRERFIEQFAQGKSAKDIFGFDEAFMQKFYHAAYKILKDGRHAEALNAFTFLVTINPYSEIYWLGLGMAAQKCNDFEMAINAFEMAAIVNIESPLPYFYLGKAFYAINDLPNSLKAFEMALEFIEVSNGFEEIKLEAEKAKKQLIDRIQQLG